MSQSTLAESLQIVIHNQKARLRKLYDEASDLKMEIIQLENMLARCIDGENETTTGLCNTSEITELASETPQNRWRKKNKAKIRDYQQEYMRGYRASKRK